MAIPSPIGAHLGEEGHSLSYFEFSDLYFRFLGRRNSAKTQGPSVDVSSPHLLLMVIPSPMGAYFGEEGQLIPHLHVLNLVFHFYGMRNSMKTSSEWSLSHCFIFKFGGCWSFCHPWGIFWRSWSTTCVFRLIIFINCLGLRMMGLRMLCSCV